MMIIYNIISHNSNKLRPGPLAIGTDKLYSNRKNGFESITQYLRGIDDITKDTFGCIIYQEQLMLIAKKVAKFNDAQSDSIMRKAVSKKKKALMQLCKQLLIYGKKNCQPPKEYDSENLNQVYYDPECKYGDEILGAINNGYEISEMEEFWSTLQGFASYLFNKSHSASYSVITLCTMYLKASFPEKFYAALLSMQESEIKIETYVNVCRKNNIEILVPDVNNSEYDFVEKDSKILYGLKSIKSVGDVPIKNVLEKRPFTSMMDFISRLSKSEVNKKAGENMIKAGCFDSINTNRYELLNLFRMVRKIKDEEILDVEQYSEDATINFEKDTLSASITYTPWWQSVSNGEFFTQEFEIISVRETMDKKHHLMAFAKLKNQINEIDCVIFSKTYSNSMQALDVNLNTKIVVEGKRDGNKIIANKIYRAS